jgi:hypothetical protein
VDPSVAAEPSFDELKAEISDAFSVYGFIGAGPEHEPKLSVTF